MNDFGYQIVTGKYPGSREEMTPLRIFARNSTLKSGLETVWEVDTLYPWDSLTTAQVLYVVSDSGDEDCDVTIIGLDENYVEKQVTVSITGTAPVSTGSETFLRVTKILTSTVNLGEITVRVTSGSGTIVGIVSEGDAISHTGIYTVPSQHTAFFMGGDFNTSKGGDADCKFYVREFGGPFRLVEEAAIYESSSTKDFIFPIVIPEKSDIDFRALTSTSNSVINLVFNILLVNS